MTTAIRRALISVSDKAGVADFARALTAMGVEIISTGGTARALRSDGVQVTDVEAVTGCPEMLDGRVKTLHPAIHGALLFRRDNPAHVAAASAAGMTPIDLLCVNLYPFDETVRSGAAVEECIENIDIGGPAMIRAAAKNLDSVTVVVDPRDYGAILDEMAAADGAVGAATRRVLAAKAFEHVSAYDARIASWMRGRLADHREMPDQLTVSARLAYRCRYGENPHQAAAFYRQEDTGEPCIGYADVLNGKPLSFNNLADADAALEAVKDFDEAPSSVIVKHMNPCGLAQGATIAEAFAGALEGDPVSAFGGIAAFSRRIDAACARAITEPGRFFEVVIAPGYDDDALEILRTRRKWGVGLRILSVPALEGWRDRAATWRLRQITGGLLVQERDLRLIKETDLSTATRRAPTAGELAEMLFAVRAVKHVKSNAIVLSKDRRIVGVGAGQMNRVQSVRLAVEQAGGKAKGSVMASDAFFPFADGPEAAANAGVTAIIQPGGSRRDDETIRLADERGMAMVFTGVRHFRH